MGNRFFLRIDGGLLTHQHMAEERFALRVWSSVVVLVSWKKTWAASEQMEGMSMVMDRT